LIDIIQNLRTFQTPKLQYEQYITDAVATADLLFHIAFEQQDLIGKCIVDLGCGTGNLTIAAALLGADHILAADIDDHVLLICEENLQSLELQNQVRTFHGDITHASFLTEVQKFHEKHFEQGTPIVVISNPPFGVHQKGADTLFLSQALKFADIIYSIHLATEKTRQFLTRKIPQLGGVIMQRSTLSLMLQHTYDHQQKKRKKIQTDVYRIVRKR
jgi:putative methylase